MPIKRVLVIILFFSILSSNLVSFSQEIEDSDLEAKLSNQVVVSSIDDYFCKSTCASSKSLPVCCDGTTLLCPPRFRDGLTCREYNSELLSTCNGTSDGHPEVALPACINSKLCIQEECSSVCNSNVAYFELYRVDWPHTFIIKLTDKAKIEEARKILVGNNGLKVHIAGKVVKEPASYNEPWSYHLDPSSIYFFERAVEVCDGHYAYVEEHLDAAGGAFLPGLLFCPWGSQILREVTCECNCNPSIPPVLRSVLPNAGKSGDKIKIVVTGIKPEDLSNSKVKVYFGSVAAIINNASNLSNGRDTQLNVTVPSGAGKVDITATNTNGQRSLNALKFTYQK